MRKIINNQNLFVTNFLFIFLFVFACSNCIIVEQILALQYRFQKDRSLFPPIFIVTPLDMSNINGFLNNDPAYNKTYDGKFPSYWTSTSKPSMQDLFKLIVLAKDCESKLRKLTQRFESVDSFKVTLISSTCRNKNLSIFLLLNSFFLFDFLDTF